MPVEGGSKKATKGRGRFLILGCSVALLTFSQSFTGIILTDLIVYRTCLISLGTNHTYDCSMAHTNDSSIKERLLEAEAEPLASMIVMVKTLIESILSAVLSLFLGPWSDRGGRKPLLLGGLTGFTLMFGLLSLLCSWDVSPWYLIIPSIPGYILGGSGTVILAAMCYISDTTAEKDRTMLMAWLQASIFGGVVLGVFGGPIIFQNCGYTTVFSIGAMCCASALLIIYFTIPESAKDATEKSQMHGLFEIALLKKLATSIIVKRYGFHRPVVWLVMFIFTTCAMIIAAETSIGFLFVKARLGWDVAQYSYVNGVGLLLNITALFGVSLLGHSAGSADTLLAVVGLTSGLIGSIVKAFATKAWHMYFSVSIAMFGGIVAPVMRSILSKSVPAEDIGTVLSLAGLLEVMSPLAGAPLFTLIFSNYLPPIYPTPVFLLSTSLFALLIVCTVYTEVLIRRFRKLVYIAAPQKE
ncbi:tetracycline resistance protein, class D-like isoform X1 [Neodiprion virginianus]|uniref:tetracycline resistance protein, class D-like isoform X1 n=1 Tax=Neodiprion virginianus TaxID=2961670 RepID=UPI001EE7127B|nr:tetracycline resistance protein, class D-like isoform X1 [Neodiprion virginianus]XP_046615098.1 tetracycline resistance protein, class D-like isoform X1 [Neodiprion virginianus]XP_046615099.1 tetracycline resistance protein, class D-like isoform X1 [Neodiprion virginianus]XP_046615100.1 tetracycline resistance protein, class D-like isoform X1 [Neodiprion virginianus]XP_046615101.1 tetracycline resistance protein, class D-like isoform X1 [Neodiprion virginianus]XP_046615102.1 tetracycline re